MTSPLDALLAPLGPIAFTRDRAGLVERLRLTAVAAGHVAVMPIALVLVIFAVLAVPLALITVGLAIAWVVVPASAALVDVHRYVVSQMLATPIDSGYAPDADGLIARPLGWLRDAARRRDLGFLAFAATGGFLLSLLPVAFLAAPITLVVLMITGLTHAWAVIVAICALELAAWWLATPWLVRARLRADRAILGGSHLAELQRRVRQVEASRGSTLDASAAEIRRIERDLHDGAQARLASVAMSVGLAEKLLSTDPQAAAELLREARESATAALADVRSVVRDIHPPVLADLGLAGAIEALALGIPIPVQVSVTLTERLPAPLESAAYFAVAEALANTVKHAGATRAWVAGSVTQGSISERCLHLLVGDDGSGGADLAGSGLKGLARRLGAFDGRLEVRSPSGGPTVIRMEIPV